MEHDMHVAQLTLQIDADAAYHAEELDRLTRQLRDELQDVPEVESAELLKGGTAPAGSKVVDPITIGALLIAILPGAIPKLLEVINGWSMRGENRKIKIKTQVGDRAVEVEYAPSTMSQQELKTLVETLTGAMQTKQV